MRMDALDSWNQDVHAITSHHPTKPTTNYASEAKFGCGFTVNHRRLCLKHKPRPELQNSGVGATLPCGESELCSSRSSKKSIFALPTRRILKKKWALANSPHVSISQSCCGVSREEKVERISAEVMQSGITMSENTAENTSTKL